MPPFEGPRPVSSRRMRVVVRKGEQEPPEINQSFCDKVTLKYGAVHFFNLHSHDCPQLVFARTCIKFLKSRHAQFSQGTRFARELDLELPVFSVVPLFQNTIYFTTYLHNLNSMFLNGRLAQEYLQTRLPDATIRVINLSSRPDRWRRIADSKFKRFCVERFEAVRGRPGLGWEGCARSHMELVAAAKQRGAPYVIVAEDDFSTPIDLDAWEARLWAILHWLLRNPEAWGVFNGHPSGRLVDTPVAVLSRELGVVEMPGGLTTHFIVYNSMQYNRVLAWYSAYAPQAASTPEACEPAMLAQIHPPPPSSFGGSRYLFLAIDRWLSDHCTVVAALPMLSISVSDDSDIAAADKFKQYSQVLHHFYDVWTFQQLAEPLFAHCTPAADSDVTVVCTSCGRWSYLCDTLASFFRSNSYPVRAVIIAEDSGDTWIADNIRRRFPRVRLLFDGKSKGRLARLQEAWACVDTKYIFHLEDAWSFRRPFFIEKSHILLEHDRTLINVWLRDLDDTNLQPIAPRMHQCRGIIFWKLQRSFAKDLHAPSWSPTLLRKEVVATVSAHGSPSSSAAESKLSSHLQKLAFGLHFCSPELSAAILPGGFAVQTEYLSTCPAATQGTPAR